MVGQASINSGDNQELRKSYGNYDFVASRKQVRLLELVKMVCSSRNENGFTKNVM